MAETAPASENGIEGVIYISPSRPGPQRIDMPNKAPVANIDFVVLKGKEKEKEKVASFTTDAEGHFRVTVPPGHYTITRKDGGATIGRWHYEVEVVAGKMAQVDWTADSGMR
ncbi:MAG: carboxypeptidase-like regulatory domain-containing protein [Chthoniobacterales bacterium]